MKVAKFETYEEYVKIQTEINKRKLDRVAVTDKELQFIASYIKEHISQPSFGICHGVRNGYEVKQFRELLRIDVIGTEISETATQFENVIQWDFHEVKDEWNSNVDFIYSNSWDHSYDPQKLFDQWMSCIKPTGRCFVQWTEAHSEAGVKEADCFGASLSEMQAILNAKYQVEEVISIQPPLDAKLILRSITREFFKTGKLNVRKIPSCVIVVKHNN